MIKVSSAAIHVALKGMRRGGVLAFFDHQIDGLGSDEFDIGAGGVEVRVVRNDVALFAGDAEEDALGSASLMRGDDVAVAEDFLDGALEMVEAAAAGVAFIAFHHSGPLVGGHGSGAGVGEQVDKDVVSRKKKQVVMGGFQELLALLASRPADRFNALVTEGFDDGFDGHGFPSYLESGTLYAMPT